MTPKDGWTVLWRNMVEASGVVLTIVAITFVLAWGLKFLADIGWI